MPAMAARTLVVPNFHDCCTVFQAYPGSSDGNFVFDGPDCPTDGTDAITAVPGVLSIVPGDNWNNFIDPDVDYYIKNVTLKKQTPIIGQCADVFPAETVTQHGTANIRLWWPLMFEVPGTCWTLTITWGTYVPYDDDGTGGPNPLSYVHTDVFCWCVDADLESLLNLLDLFHEIPYGTDQVPLIGNEELFPDLVGYIQDAIDADDDDLATIGSLLITFDMEVSDNCIDESPDDPNPVEDQGIAGDECYPACCKLIVDAEYIANALGAWIPSK